MSRKVEATVEQGTLRGYLQTSVAIFKGVPYARSPIGDLRWQAPEPPESWDGVRQATKFSAAPWQRGTDIFEFMDALIEGVGHGYIKRTFIKLMIKLFGAEKESEDCLYLNIRTPNLETDQKLPVMVWIHGGDHQDGSGSEPFYDSNTLPELGVVLVTINYRLGLFGYFCHPELLKESEIDVCGNYGTLDQIAALKWIKKNIHVFGGDAENVTIFGESAGGESVAHMLTSPLADGLFHRAILQSAANSGQMYQMDNASLYHRAATDIGSDFATKIVGDGEPLDLLRQLPAEKLMAAVRQEEGELGSFFPVIDGYVMPCSPLEGFQRGLQAKVPMMVGSNADEGSVIWPMMKTPVVARRFDDTRPDKIEAMIEEEFGEDAVRLFELYPGLIEGSEAAQSSMLGDSMFGANAYFYARQHAQSGEKSFLYFFSQTSPLPGQTAGAFHGSELAYVFGTDISILPMDAQGKDLSNCMSRYWATFARTGVPGDNALTEWQKFDPGNPMWMKLGPEVGIEKIDRHEKYSILNRHLRRNFASLALSDTGS